VPAPASRVLDALLYVRENLDPSLGFRYSCRAGMCGSCAVGGEGKEVLACQARSDRSRPTTCACAPCARCRCCAT
jgi:succinate dehydrogenase/fumarate reductase-like Fe-S protein